MLAFLIKASVAALKKFPEFNASLDGDHLVLKKYFHIGFAADTPNGLVVPVIRDADKKGVLQICHRDGRAGEEGARRQAGAGRHERRVLLDLARWAASAARYFTPIINAPEVAILGVCQQHDRAGVGRQGVPAAPDAAAVAELGPPRHRRRGGGALQRLPGRRCSADFRRVHAVTER